MVSLPTAALWTLVGLAAAWDLSQRRIPNPLVLTGLLLGLGLQTQSGGLAGLGFSILGAAAALAILIVPFALRKMGGGDVKLAMVAGAFLGPVQVAELILLGLVFHGFIAALFLVTQRLALSQGRTLPELTRVPFAVGFAIATLVLGTGLLDLW